MARGQEVKSGRQVRFLFSKGSPLNESMKKNLASEIRTGEVVVINKRNGKRVR